MITKAIVKSRVHGTNKYLVRIPLLETSKDNKEMLIQATLCVMPGQYNSFVPGDIVYVDFENNQYSQPVILGILSKDGIDGYQKESRSYINSINLDVKNTCDLPYQTSIGGMKFETLREILNKLEQSDFNILSTEEQICGTWIDNKVIFTKVIVVEHTPSIQPNTYFSKYIDISDIPFDNVWVDMSNCIQIGTKYSLNQYHYYN